MEEKEESGKLIMWFTMRCVTQ